MKKKITYVTMLLLTSTAFGQMPGNPELNEEQYYFYFPVSLSDTGSVGTNQVWDYANIDVDTMSVKIAEYRIPNQQELAMEPNANLIAETISGEINMYILNQDSITNIGFIDQTSGEYVPYADPNVLYTLPLNSNELWNSDQFSYDYNLGSMVEVKGSHRWSITGTGTLITPYGTYQDAQKVSRYFTYEFWMGGFLVTEVNMIEITYFDAGLRKALINFSFDDYVPSSSGYVLREEQSTLMLPEVQKEVVRVYPNPASDYLNFSDNVLGVEIRTMDGKMIDRFEGNEPYSLSHLNRGTYLFDLRTSTGTSTRKIVVQ